MKINNHIFYSLVLFFVLGFTSCSSDDNLRLCSDLNIISEGDFSCEEISEEYNCSCD